MTNKGQTEKLCLDFIWEINFLASIPSGSSFESRERQVKKVAVQLQKLIAAIPGKIENKKHG